MLPRQRGPIFFFFNDTATTEIYTLSLHDALPIFAPALLASAGIKDGIEKQFNSRGLLGTATDEEDSGYSETFYPLNSFRSEEHTSELQSRSDLVCRLLLEKKNNNKNSLDMLRCDY